MQLYFHRIAENLPSRIYPTTTTASRSALNLLPRADAKYFPLTVRCQKRECNREEFAQQSATDFFYSPLHNSRNQSRRKSASVIQIDGSLLDVTRHGNDSDGGKEEKDLHDKHRPSADSHRMSIPLNCPFRDPSLPLRRLSTNFSIGKLEGGSNLARCAFFSANLSTCFISSFQISNRRSEERPFVHAL